MRLSSRVLETSPPSRVFVPQKQASKRHTVNPTSNKPRLSFGVSRCAGCGGGSCRRVRRQESDCRALLSSQKPARPVPYPSPASLGHVPVEHWWQVSGSVPARPGCLIQAVLSECTAAGRRSAAPGAGHKQVQETEFDLNRQTSHDQRC